LHVEGGEPLGTVGSLQDPSEYRDRILGWSVDVAAFGSRAHR
jgi:hypothetical protein